MPGGNNKLRPEDNPKPFTSDYQPTKEQRKKAGMRNRGNKNISSKLVELLQNEGTFKIAKNLLIKETDDEYIFEFPNINTVAAYWIMDAQSGKSHVRSRARETLIERIEGKTPQHLTIEPIQRYDLSKLSIDELKSIAAAGNGRSSDRNVKKKSV